MLPFAQAQPNKFADLIDTLARTPLSKVVIFVVICTIIRIAVYPVLMKTPAHQRGLGYGVARFANEMLDAIIYAGVFVFLLVRPFGVQTFRIPSESMVSTLLIDDFLVINKAVYRYSDPKPGDIVVFKPPTYACTADQIDEDGQPKVDFIKRCVGVAGDVVEIRNGVLFRNGQPVDEPFRNGINQLDFKLVKYNGSYTTWKGRYIPVQFRDQYYNWFLDGIAQEFAVGGLPEESSPAPWQNSWITTFDKLSPEQQELEDELRNSEPAAIPKGYFLMMGDNRQRSFDGRAWGLVPREDIVGRAEVIWWPARRMKSERGHEGQGTEWNWQRTPSIPLDPPASGPGLGGPSPSN
ncbi:MAG: signal peptidase I [Fimbriimonadaceae bacterium]|nr:signal peptidase I [Fimbriimonadaceae bacterium]